MAKKKILKELSRYNTGTFADVIYRNALLQANERAFACGEKSVTFSQFNDHINALIHAILSMEGKKGDVLGILSWNCIEYAEVYGSAMKFGFISSPFNPRLKEQELEYLINYSECRTLFVGPGLTDLVDKLKPKIPQVKNFIYFGAEKINGMVSYDYILETFPKTEPEIDLTEDDPVFLFYTSGTTGTPRAAVYTQANGLDDTRRLSAALGLGPAVRQVQIMPLFHIGGSKNFWAFYYAGGCNIIMPQISFDPDAVLQTLQDEKATDIHIVPTHLAAFLALPNVDQYDLSNLQRMFYAASPMPVELLKQGMTKWGSIFVQGYGGTETGPNSATLSTRQHDVVDKSPEEQEILASCGLPHIGVHIRIIDEKDEDVEPGGVGEIIIKSKSVPRGWWRKPEESAETFKNGWVYTGDMGKYDEKGYIYIVDRKKDMIITGGENVFPREVEEVLYRHPAVLEAAVYGIPDPYWVEKVCAAIVLKSGEKVSSEEITDFCKKQLAGYKTPKRVEFMDTLPKTASGKILKRELRNKESVE